MFERFTDRARRIVVLAQEEARMMNSKAIHPEHVLMGIILEDECMASRVLREIMSDHTKERLFDSVALIVGTSDTTVTCHIPFTMRSKKIFELSLREALQLGHNYIGPEHILLGIVREAESSSLSWVLTSFGVSPQDARSAIIRALSGSYSVDTTKSFDLSGTFVEPDSMATVVYAVLRHEPEHDIKVLVDLFTTRKEADTMLERAALVMGENHNHVVEPWAVKDSCPETEDWWSIQYSAESGVLNPPTRARYWKDSPAKPQRDPYMQLAGNSVCLYSTDERFVENYYQALQMMLSGLRSDKNYPEEPQGY